MKFKGVQSFVIYLNLVKPPIFAITEQIFWDIVRIFYQKTEVNLFKMLAEIIESYIKNTEIASLQFLFKLFSISIINNFIPKCSVFFACRSFP